MGYGVGMAKNASTLVKNINVLIVQVPQIFCSPDPTLSLLKLYFILKI